MYSVISEDQNSSAGKKSEWKSDLVKKKKKSEHHPNTEILHM